MKLALILLILGESSNKKSLTLVFMGLLIASLLTGFMPVLQGTANLQTPDSGKSKGAL